MNKYIQKFVRDTLKRDLFWCTPEQQMIFKRMYAFKNIEWCIHKVVDNMPSDKLDWAMQQVKQTLIKNEKVRQNTCL